LKTSSKLIWSVIIIACGIVAMFVNVTFVSTIVSPVIFTAAAGGMSFVLVASGIALMCKSILNAKHVKHEKERVARDDVNFL